MSNAVQKITEACIGAAAESPDDAPEIFRHAAQTFANLASDERNPAAVKQLTNIGLEFAGAASKAQQHRAKQAAYKGALAIAQQDHRSSPTADDFTSLLRSTAQAWDQLGPSAASTSAALDVMAIERAISTKEAQQTSVSTQPTSFLNKDATLGRAATVTFNPTQEQISNGIFQTQTVAFWQGTKKESQAMSIDFGTVLPPPLTLLPSEALSAAAAHVEDARPYAVIQYGADGNTQNSVTLDVGLGRRVTVVGNYISVQVGMDPPRRITSPPSPFAGEGVSPVLTVGASIGTFAAPSIAPVTRTVYVDQVAAAGSGPTAFAGPYPIPLRAVQMLPPLGATTTSTLTITFLNFNGRYIGQWACTFSPTTPFWTPYPVPPDAYFFTVVSSVAVPAIPPLPFFIPTNGIRIPFQLSL